MHSYDTENQLDLSAGSHTHKSLSPTFRSSSTKRNSSVQRHAMVRTYIDHSICSLSLSLSVPQILFFSSRFDGRKSQSQDTEPSLSATFKARLVFGGGKRRGKVEQLRPWCVRVKESNLAGLVPHLPANPNQLSSGFSLSFERVARIAECPYTFDSGPCSLRKGGEFVRPSECACVSESTTLVRPYVHTYTHTQYKILTTT